MYYEQMHNCLYASVPMPRLLIRVLRDVDCWRRFCQLPGEIKQLFAFPDHNDKRSDTDPGYKERARADGRDAKVYIHFTRSNPELVHYYGLNTTVMREPIIRNFFDFAALVDDEVEPMVLEIGADLERYIPGIVDQMRKGRDDWVTRYLYYTPAPGDVVLADPHFDRGGLTIHLWESLPGLQLLGWDNQWFNAPVQQGRALMYPAYRLQTASDGILQNTWHQVIRSQTEVEQPVQNRVSIILFVPLPDVPGYPKDKRAQEEVPGYRPRKPMPLLISP